MGKMKRKGGGEQRTAGTGKVRREGAANTGAKKKRTGGRQAVQPAIERGGGLPGALSSRKSQKGERKKTKKKDRPDIPREHTTGITAVRIGMKDELKDSQHGRPYKKLPSGAMEFTKYTQEQTAKSGLE